MHTACSPLCFAAAVRCLIVKLGSGRRSNLLGFRDDHGPAFEGSVPAGGPADQVDDAWGPPAASDGSRGAAQRPAAAHGGGRAAHGPAALAARPVRTPGRGLSHGWEMFAHLYTLPALVFMSRTKIGRTSSNGRLPGQRAPLPASAALACPGSASRPSHGPQPVAATTSRPLCARPGPCPVLTARCVWQPRSA